MVVADARRLVLLACLLLLSAVDTAPTWDLLQPQSANAWSGAPLLLSFNVMKPEEDGGGSHGHVQVHEGQEVADAVYAFDRDVEASMGRPLGRGARQTLWNAICGQGRGDVMCQRDYAVLLTQQVGLHMLEVREGEEVAESATRLSLTAGGGTHHRYSADERHNLAANICAQHNKGKSSSVPLPCTRLKPVAIAQNFQFGSTQDTVRTAVVLEGEECVDAVAPYCVQWGLHGTALCDQVFQTLCAAAQQSTLAPPHHREESMRAAAAAAGADPPGSMPPPPPPSLSFPFRCTRSRAKVFDQSFAFEVEGGGKKEATLVVHSDEEPADVVSSFAKEHGMAETLKRVLVKRVCDSPDVACSREEALVFEQDLRDEHNAPIGRLQVLEGDEPVDVVYKFIAERGLPLTYQPQLLEMVCGSRYFLSERPCLRDKALLASQRVSSASDTDLGTVEVWQGEYGAEKVQQFGRNHGLAPAMLQVLQKAVCDVPLVVCERTRHIVYRRHFNDERGAVMPELVVYHDEEPADQVWRYIKDPANGVPLPYWKPILSNVCGTVRCNRHEALVYSGQVAGHADTLNIFSNEEVVDGLHRFCRERGIGFDARNAMLVDLCQRPEVVRLKPCMRAEPLLTFMNINAGDKSGVVKVYEGQEPVDVAYEFVKEKEMINQPETLSVIMDEICARDGVTCGRVTPYETLFTLEVKHGPLTYCIDYTLPPDEWECADGSRELGGGKQCTHRMVSVARQWCRRYAKDWEVCEDVVIGMMEPKRQEWEEGRWKEDKDHYLHLGVARFIDESEVEEAYHRVKAQYDPTKEPDKHKKIEKAYAELRDAEKRSLFDAPCVMVFGMCGKRSADGGIQFISDGDLTITMGGDGGPKKYVPPCRIY